MSLFFKGRPWQTTHANEEHGLNRMKPLSIAAFCFLRLGRWKGEHIEVAFARSSILNVGHSDAFRVWDEFHVPRCRFNCPDSSLFLQCVLAPGIVGCPTIFKGVLGLHLFHEIMGFKPSVPTFFDLPLP